MSQNYPDDKVPGEQTGHRTGNLSAIIVLIVLVLASMVLVLFLPDQSASQTLALTQTAEASLQGSITPSLAQTESVVVPVQVVNIDGIIILGGGLVLLVLFAVLREIVWYQRRP